MVKLLIPTPNAANKLGFNTDRFVFDPSCTTAKDMKHFKFLGILFGVAMRTKKPLDLHLAQAMWKLLAGMSLTQEDLEEVCWEGEIDSSRYGSRHALVSGCVGVDRCMCVWVGCVRLMCCMWE